MPAFGIVVVWNYHRRAFGTTHFFANSYIYNMTTLAEILENKIIAIIRGAEPSDMLHMANALYEGGIRLMEITLNSTDALKVIEKLALQIGEKIIIGAGTVLHPDEANRAINAGAKFIISPSTDEKTIQSTKQSGAVSIPGAFTPTEIVCAYKYGGDIIKLFPATAPQYLKDILAPLSSIPVMPTGGVNLRNIRAYQEAGAVAFGIGSSLIDTKQKVTDAYLQQITRHAREFVMAVQ